MKERCRFCDKANKESPHFHGCDEGLVYYRQQANKFFENNPKLKQRLKEILNEKELTKMSPR